MTTIPSTPYSRDLGDELRRLREKHTRYNGSALSDLLSWDQSKVSNIENGRARASEIDLVQYLTACGQDRDFINEFLDRYRDAFNHHYVQVPGNLRTMVMAESSANKITSYDDKLIPGLLQLEEYTEEVFRRTGLTTEDEMKAGVRFRVERQSILRRPDRPEATFYVHESALHLRIGSVELMKAQLTRLLFNTHVVRIVRANSAPPLLAGFVLWEFEKAAPVAFTESDLAKVFLQDPVSVASCRSIFQRLDEVALDAGQSRRVLAKLVGSLREDRDDPGVAQEQL
jgi:hypothetical protein